MSFRFRGGRISYVTRKKGGVYILQLEVATRLTSSSSWEFYIPMEGTFLFSLDEKRAEERLDERVY